MRALLWVALLSGCEREAPSCEAVARHALEHVHARPFVTDAERVLLKIRVPFSVALTEDDAAYVESECSAWSADYRLCVVDHRGSGFHCGEEDIVWSTLPHVRDWHEALETLAGTAHFTAVERATAADREVDRLLAEVGLVEKSLDAGPRGAREQYGSELRAHLERAQHKQRAARQLARACEIRPLEQIECVTLLD